MNGGNKIMKKKPLVHPGGASGIRIDSSKKKKGLRLLPQPPEFMAGTVLVVDGFCYAHAGVGAHV